MRTRTFVLAVLALGLLPSAARANGFLLMEFGAAATGQSGACAAGCDDPSMVYFNPAHLVNLEGLRLMAGSTLYLGTNSFTGAASGITTKAVGLAIPTPFLFASWRFWDYMAAGFGGYINYGLTMEWPEEWEGSSQVIKAGLQTFTFNPALSFRLPWVEGLSFGAGFEAIMGTAYLKQGLDLVDTQGASELGGKGVVYGFNVGVRYQPADFISIGAVYHHTKIFTVDDATMRFDVPAELSGQFPDQTTSARIALPGSVVGAVRVWPIEALTLELDFVWIFWSAYDRLEFDLAKDLPQDRVVLRKDYSDAPQIRLGAEYTFNESWRARLGLIWDHTPVPDRTLDPSLPDSHRIDASIGGGWSYKGLDLDLSYMLVGTFPRSVSAASGNPLPGKYKPLAHNIVLSAGYRFF